MALKYPDRLESNNPAAYGIVKAVEVAGHKTVATVADLYTLADPILSDSKSNANNDAIGQEWYVRDQACLYRLISWADRKQASGWQKINTDIELVEKIDNHINDKDNPHEVTKAQVGLGNVDNTADIDKPVSNAVQEQLDTKFGEADLATGTITNTITFRDKTGGTLLDSVEIPGATDSKAGLLSATDKAKIDTLDETYVKQSDLGVSVPQLDESGKVPASQLPTYVDDVLEGTLVSTTEFTLNEGQQGEVKQSGVVYVDTTTNKSYRWSGSQYVMTGSDLALGETSSTAYTGDKGKANRDAINSLPSNIIIGHGGFTANKNNVTTSIQYVSKTGLNYGTQKTLEHTIPVATTTTAGVMSAQDKVTLDSALQQSDLDKFNQGVSGSYVSKKTTEDFVGDLNTLQDEAAVYRIGSRAENKPREGNGGTLYVSGSKAKSLFTQIMVFDNDGEIWTRAAQSTNWSNWYKLIRTEDTLNYIKHLPESGGMYMTYDEMLAAVNAESELSDDTITGYGVNQASKIMTVTYLDDRWNNLVKATIIQTVSGGMVQQYWFDPFQIQVRERKYPFTSNQWTDLVVMTPGTYGDGTRAGLMTPEDKEKLDLIDFNTTVNENSGAVTATINPNDFVIFGECTSLNITLADDLEGKTSEYTFQFTSGDQSTVLTLPTNIQWIGSNQILPNTTYQVSIQNNIAVMGGF